MKNSLKYAFLEFVNYHQLIQHNQAILVAVSGGIDSMTLLHLIMTWQQYFDLKIGVAHFNHALRGREADEDELFVEEFCKQHNLPFFHHREDVRIFADEHNYSLEEAARILREGFLTKCRKEAKFDAVATGHTLNDQVETILMRLLAGSGLEGLAGIRMERPGFIRPLLFARRSDIEHYAANRKIRHREDPSNRQLNFLRNKIRRQLIPYLQEEFDLSNLNSFLNISLILQEWLPEVYRQSDMLFQKAVHLESENKIRLDIDAYKNYFSWIQVKALEKILSILTDEDVKITYNQFSDFSKWLNKDAECGKFMLGSGILITRKKRELVFQRRENIPTNVALNVEIFPGAIHRIPELGIVVKISRVTRREVQFRAEKSLEYLDARQMDFPLILRNWRSGDRFQPLGFSHQKKISDFLTNEKDLMLPKRQMLVLENKEEIAAVIGCRINEKYKVTNQSQQILKIKVIKT